MKRVVITGLGAITAAGEGSSALWEAVKSGCSAIDAIHFQDSGQGWDAIGARIANFEAEKYVTQRKSLKVMARDIQLAVAGASLAMEDSKLKKDGYDCDRFGVIMGSGVLNHELDELAYSVANSLGDDKQLDIKKFGDAGLSSLFPLWLLKYLPNMPACHISILFDLRGMNNTITVGASGGLQAIGEALRIIQRGDADLMLAGGAESKLNPVGLSQYKILGALCGDTAGDPKKIYKPFHQNSKGFVVGEGAAFLVLEELGHAQKRGAKIYAEVLGFGASYRDGHSIAMNSALKDAKISSDQIHYLQASGIGIQREDQREMEAIREVFGQHSKNLQVSASKPIIGFTGFSAGALDLVISTMALGEQRVPPTLNYEKTIQETGFKISSQVMVSQSMECAMTNAFGFNGQTASIITRVFGESKK